MMHSIGECHILLSGLRSSSVQVAMFLIYLTFRKQEKAMVTYSRNAGMEANHKQSRMVAMQGMFFVVSFFLAWIFVFVSLLLHWCLDSVSSFSSVLIRNI